MPLLAMFIARSMMIVAVICSLSMYFYVYILNHPPFFHRSKTAYVQPRIYPWDRADRRKVIIVTNPSIDPNVIGKIFNRHPRIFYLEQPLYPFEMFLALNYTKRSTYNGQVRAFLDNLFNCRFNGYKDYLTFLSHPGLSSPRYRLSSKALSSPPLCKSEVITYTNTSDFLSKCPILNSRWVSIVCSRKMHVVVSVFANRAPGEGLAGLVPLMTSESMTTRVLHLVQDPRATVWDAVNNSEKPQGSDSQQDFIMEDKVKKICSEISKEVNFSLSLPRDLIGQYQVIRYEDVRRNLTETAQIAFKFAGIDLVPEINEYVNNEGQDLVFDHNDSKWRLGMSMDLVTKVERHCTHVMKLLGYKPLDREKDLRNLGYSLLTNPRTV